MSSTESYVDHCLSVAQAIDIDAISVHEIGDRIGYDGIEYSMRTLGSISIQGADTYVGVKLPRNQHVELRYKMWFELPSIDLLINRLPELKPQVPQFMAMLAIGNGEPCAILTEDATRGNRANILPKTYNDKLARLIAGAFNEPEDSAVKVDKYTIMESLSFDVDGCQRLLDFTPPPFEIAREDSIIEDRVYELLYESRDLIIDIPQTSPLGISLTAAQPKN